MRALAILTVAPMKPNVYIIAGPNGEGKTTFARRFLPQYAECRNFINADLIAQGLAPFVPEAAAFKAGKLVLEEIWRYIKNRDDFAFETTLAGRSYLRLMRRLRDAGYNIHIFFLWLPTPEVALSRIRERVAQGGHDVPPKDVLRRYDRSIANFFRNYSDFADPWMLFNSEHTPPKLVALKQADRLRIIDEQLFASLRSTYAYEKAT